MNRTFSLLITAAAMVAVVSCDEDTASMGNSLTESVDKFVISTDTFTVSTRSIMSDSVLARSTYSYLGSLVDPETGAYVSCDYTTRFNILESTAPYLLPDDSLIASRDADGKIIADSCALSIMIESFQGDSLAAMKLHVSELSSPIPENVNYYTNFSPESAGYVRTDANAVDEVKFYSIADLTLSDSARAANSSSSYFQSITIPLNKPYTDHNGNTYSNYGTYLLQSYYSAPDNFKNAITFASTVCPGFLMKSEDGEGVLSKIYNTRLEVYFRFKEDTIVSPGLNTFVSTEEVLQTTHISNDAAVMNNLLSDNSCTYLKSPAGMYTEVELPIDSIKMGRSGNGEHLNDTLALARIEFQTLRERHDGSKYDVQPPSYLLMVERDSMYTFFEDRLLADNTSSFLASYSDSDGTYLFSNISTLVNKMWAKKGLSPNWNKVVLIPVEVTTSSTGTSSSTTIVSINNELGITSTRLVGGSENSHSPVRISVMYNKNN